MLSFTGVGVCQGPCVNMQTSRWEAGMHLCVFGFLIH